jgi:hypothetical protein
MMIVQADGMIGPCNFASKAKQFKYNRSNPEQIVSEQRSLEHSKDISYIL